MSARSMLVRMTVTALAFATLAGCTWRGGDIGDPATRKFHWFSFVDGEDIRGNCAAATPDRYRLVYNGIYQEQLRIYEFDGLRRVLGVTVYGGAPDLGRFDPSDLLAPWHAKESRVPLDEAAYGRLVESLAASGAFAPPPVGLDLPSRSYFWTLAYCRDGHYGLTAWKYPSERFASAAFPAQVFALDPTGVPVNQAKPVPLDPLWEDKAKRNEVTDFTLKVGRNGLVR